MKIEDVRAMKTDQLHHELERLRRHLFDLRSQAVTEKLEDPSQLGKTKRNIARIMTVLRMDRDEKFVEQKQAALTAQAARNK